MQIKKFILAVFIVFSLSFSYQPVTIYSKEKEPVVFILNYEHDSLTYEFINKNESKKFIALISISLKIMVCNRESIFFNTS
jgi:hypothetical protein